MRWDNHGRNGGGQWSLLRDEERRRGDTYLLHKIQYFFMVLAYRAATLGNY
jgi:hypothetical protein